MFIIKLRTCHIYPPGLREHRGVRLSINTPSMNGPSLNLLAGPQLMGFFLNWMLQGVLTVQCTDDNAAVAYYHTWFPCDHLGLKSLVYGIFLYEWVQTGLITAVPFDNFVYHYGSVAALTEYQNSWFSVTVMSAIAASVVQCFFAWRIFIIGRSKLLTATIVILAFCQLAVGVAGGVLYCSTQLKVLDPSAAETSAVFPVIASWFAAAAAVDLIIAVSMSILLLRKKSLSEITKSNDVINKLIRLGMRRARLLYHTERTADGHAQNTLLHECTTLVLPKLYSNSLLVSLNNRVFMHRNGDNTTVVVDSYPMTTVTRRLSGSIGVGNDKSGATVRHVGDTQDHVGIQVQVHEVTFSDHDETHVEEASVKDAKAYASHDGFV
ncbi:hypothetical protein C8T65DRAFT_701444 [Cerioporus squamosus]|nr:hypothetical protein C8T65DRAFT_701444 [Cerioporus squamosus]